MNSIRTVVLWFAPIWLAFLSMPVAADIPSNVNQCVLDSVESTPSSDFTVLEGGAVVRHEPTGLEWQRCVEGMSWTGTSCSGSPRVFLSWQGALQYADGVSGWRLPNISELRTIVERCRRDPAINQQVFPETPSLGFWSSSPFVGLAFQSWGVSFRRGHSITPHRDRVGGPGDSASRVRLVRGGL